MVLSLNTIPNSHGNSSNLIWDQIQTSLDRLNSNYQERTKRLEDIQVTCNKICATLRIHRRLQQPPIFQIHDNPEADNSTTPEAEIFTALQFGEQHTTEAEGESSDFNLVIQSQQQQLEESSPSRKFSYSSQNNSATNLQAENLTTNSDYAIQTEIPVHTQEEDEEDEEDAEEESDLCFLVQPQQQQAKSTEMAVQTTIQQSSLSSHSYKYAVPQFQQQQQNSCQTSKIMEAEEEELDANSDSTNNSTTNLQNVSTILDPDFQFHIQTKPHQRYLFPGTSSTDLNTQATRISILESDFLIQGPAYLYAGTQSLDAGGRPWRGTNPVEDEAAAYLTTGSGAEDGTSVKGEQMLATPWVDGMAAATGTGDPRRCGGGFRRVSPILARPAPLLAAVFPWDLEEEARTTKKQVAVAFPGNYDGARDSDGLPQLALDSATDGANGTEGRWRRSHWSQTVVLGSPTVVLLTAAPHLVERERGEMRLLAFCVWIVMEGKRTLNLSWAWSAWVQPNFSFCKMGSNFYLAH